MKFLNNLQPSIDLTYDDVFLVPSFSDIESRLKVDLTTPDKTGASLPVVVANMTAIAGKRMAETITRRGGLCILPQDLPEEKLSEIISYIKSRHLVYDTPLTLEVNNTVSDALSIINKRSHNAVIIVDNKQRPIGLFKEKDGLNVDQFTPLSNFVDNTLVIAPYNLSAEQVFDLLVKNHIDVAPIVNKDRLVGVMTKKGAVRSSLYKPTVDKKGNMLVAAAIGVNGDSQLKAKRLIDLGVDIIVLDTAHGHQQKMIEAIKAVKKISNNTIIVAGNVVTRQGTIDLINAGADIVKVGVGPGAMCTTRMMTGVGRPQFSAVVECSLAAKELNKSVWADGGVRSPRDIALALAAGASNVMFGSWFAGTYESPGDVIIDNNGRKYKENFGMASKRAVSNRFGNASLYDQSIKGLFEEGISSGRYYIDPDIPGVEDILDQISSGVRSSMSYAGAKNIEEFQLKAMVGLQSASGYKEGQPVHSSWA
jgi:IMP dehydrogenase